MGVDFVRACLSGCLCLLVDSVCDVEVFVAVIYLTAFHFQGSTISLVTIASFSTKKEEGLDCCNGFYIS